MWCHKSDCSNRRARLESRWLNSASLPTLQTDDSFLAFFNYDFKLIERNDKNIFAGVIKLMGILQRQNLFVYENNAEVISMLVIIVTLSPHLRNSGMFQTLKSKIWIYNVAYFPAISKALYVGRFKRLSFSSATNLIWSLAVVMGAARRPTGLGWLLLGGHWEVGRQIASTASLLERKQLQLTEGSSRQWECGNWTMSHWLNFSVWVVFISLSISVRLKIVCRVRFDLLVIVSERTAHRRNWVLDGANVRSAGWLKTGSWSMSSLKHMEDPTCVDPTLTVCSMASLASSFYGSAAPGNWRDLWRAGLAEYCQHNWRL